MVFLRKIGHHRQQRHTLAPASISPAHRSLFYDDGPVSCVYLKCIRLRTTARDLAEYRVLTHLREMGRYGAAVKR